MLTSLPSHLLRTKTTHPNFSESKLFKRRTSPPFDLLLHCTLQTPVLACSLGYFNEPLLLKENFEYLGHLVDAVQFSYPLKPIPKGNFFSLGTVRARWASINNIPSHSPIIPWVGHVEPSLPPFLLCLTRRSPLLDFRYFATLGSQD